MWAACWAAGCWAHSRAGWSRRGRAAGPGMSPRRWRRAHSGLRQLLRQLRGRLEKKRLQGTCCEVHDFLRYRYRTELRIRIHIWIQIHRICIFWAFRIRILPSSSKSSKKTLISTVLWLLCDFNFGRAARKRLQRNDMRRGSRCLRDTVPVLDKTRPCCGSGSGCYLTFRISIGILPSSRENSNKNLDFSCFATFLWLYLWAGS